MDVDTATARERLQEMRGRIDRSILVLQGEHPSGRAAADSPQDPAAGTSPDEAFGISLVATARKPRSLS